MKGMQVLMLGFKTSRTSTHAPAIKLREKSKAADLGSQAFGDLQSKVSGFRV